MNNSTRAALEIAGVAIAAVVMVLVIGACMTYVLTTLPWWMP